ncbi:hypothetical protein RDI58_003861 [Solanum bulbocastanum]|uniref:Uncharacterized protein n=1 Tax=Solanum bulbocastanum TaxID=147425 RepID=A0AAN8TY43_SOLBU
MDPNSQNSLITQVLNNVLGLDEDDSLLSQNDEHHQDSDGAYNGVEYYFHSDDDGLLNLLYEEMNQSEQEESVSILTFEHNHDLQPSLSHFFNCHWKMSKALKRSLEVHDIVRIRPAKSIRLLEVQAGEDIETYKFVFSTWLAAMGNVPPMAFLTDQCECIKEAIAEFQTHYTRSIYGAFAAEHMKRLYHFEIEKHPYFNIVEGVEKYSVTDYSIFTDFHENQFVYTMEYYPNNQYLDSNCKNFQSEGKFFQGGYQSMTNEYKKYNSLNKWFDRNCDIVLENNTKYVDFKNVLKGCFNAYSDWNDEMAIPSVGDPDSDNDVTFIRNSREV